LSRLRALVLALGLTGCAGEGALGPYYLAPPAAVTRGPGPYVISVCFNNGTHNIEEVARGVEDDCLNSAFLRREGDLTSCSLMFPVRADFRCERLSKRLATERPPMALIPLTK
jgi:hypothetical protein